MLFPLAHCAIVLDYIQLSGLHGNLTKHLGIPYAQPPVGPLRFQPPQLPSDLGYFKADKFGPSCMQKEGSLGSPNLEIDEDCLTLNVFAPPKPENLPVLVYVYGGGFDTGYSANPLYDPSHLLEERKAVIVTFNYRVGLFGGFLGSEDLPHHNLGLLDQRMAFEWVRKYIHKFGGDPNNITAFGQSAGAISIGMHLFGDRFFDRAAMYSGAPLLALRNATSQTSMTRWLARQIQCTGQIQECLQNADPHQILNYTSQFLFAPVVDGLVVQDQPQNMMSNLTQMPLLLFNNRDEGTFFTYKTVNSTSLALTFERYNYYFLDDPEFSKMETLYPFARYDQPFQKAADSFGDAVFHCASYSLSKHSNHSTRVYFYHEPKMPTVGLENLGVYHGAEVPLLWNHRDLFDPTETQTANLLQSTLFDFATMNSTLTGQLYYLTERISPGTDSNRECDFWIQAAK
ncbi:Carboxylesterase [Gorgonomyces haynaldii]|nr:Carboxylesterase [Gorgonomyces haynaldii]